jgi:endo-1,4-beta-xylanase
MRLRLPVFLLAGIVSLPAQQPTLRQAAAKRPLLIGAAADADEYGHPNRLLDPDYASALSTNFNMLEGENAMKWDSIHPSQNAYNFGPGDHLVGFAQDHQMQVRGHNLCWHSQVPAWAKTIAQTATPDAVAKLLQDHIATVVDHYKGQVFAWDVVNEAVSDSATGKGTDLRDSIWYNQPGIGMTGTGYIEQAFRWAHAADPKALLFYNDYSIEGPGPKFQAVYNMVKDFVARGVPIHGVGLQMHLTLGGFPSTVGLTQNIQQLTALGLQVHITEMDVRLKLDANGNATAADLDGLSSEPRMHSVPDVGIHGQILVDPRILPRVWRRAAFRCELPAEACGQCDDQSASDRAAGVEGGRDRECRELPGCARGARRDYRDLWCELYAGVV